MSPPGFFLVIEGPEGAGKSTLTGAIIQRLRAVGVDPVAVREPGGTLAAEALRAELLDHDRTWTPEAELLYMTTARADLVAKVIRPALARGALVLSDRFDLSTRAYQVAGRGVPADYAEWVNRAATGGLTPDLVVVLDLPDGVGRTRQHQAGKAADRLDLESTEFHRRVAAFYRSVSGPNIVHVDAAAAATDVADQVWTVLAAARPDLFPMAV
ncbi:MAG: dTMP kinase [Gemmatimonadetes bacterium]|nr:dTMP kinase [Gemmatimonadota bacterium]